MTVSNYLSKILNTRKNYLTDWNNDRKRLLVTLTNNQTLSVQLASQTLRDRIGGVFNGVDFNATFTPLCELQDSSLEEFNAIEELLKRREHRYSPLIQITSLIETKLSALKRARPTPEPEVKPEVKIEILEPEELEQPEEPAQPTVSETEVLVRSQTIDQLKEKLNELLQKLDKEKASLEEQGYLALVSNLIKTKEKANKIFNIGKLEANLHNPLLTLEEFTQAAATALRKGDDYLSLLHSRNQDVVTALSIQQESVTIEPLLSNFSPAIQNEWKNLFDKWKVEAKTSVASTAEVKQQQKSLKNIISIICEKCKEELIQSLNDGKNKSIAWNTPPQDEAKKQSDSVKKLKDAISSMQQEHYVRVERHLSTLTSSVTSLEEIRLQVVEINSLHEQLQQFIDNNAPSQEKSLTKKYLAPLWSGPQSTFTAADELLNHYINKLIAQISSLVTISPTKVTFYKVKTTNILTLKELESQLAASNNKEATRLLNYIQILLKMQKDEKRPFIQKLESLYQALEAAIPEAALLSFAKAKVDSLKYILQWGDQVNLMGLSESWELWREKAEKTARMLRVLEQENFTSTLTEFRAYIEEIKVDTLTGANSREALKLIGSLKQYLNCTVRFQDPDSVTSASIATFKQGFKRLQEKVSNLFTLETQKNAVREEIKQEIETYSQKIAEHRKDLEALETAYKVKFPEVKEALDKQENEFPTMGKRGRCCNTCAGLFSTLTSFFRSTPTNNLQELNLAELKRHKIDIQSKLSKMGTSFLNQFHIPNALKARQKYLLSETQLNAAIEAFEKKGPLGSIHALHLKKKLILFKQQEEKALKEKGTFSTLTRLLKDAPEQLRLIRLSYSENNHLDLLVQLEKFQDFPELYGQGVEQFLTTIDNDFQKWYLKLNAELQKLKKTPEIFKEANDRFNQVLKEKADLQAAFGKKHTTLSKVTLVDLRAHKNAMKQLQDKYESVSSLFEKTHKTMVKANRELQECLDEMRKKVGLFNAQDQITQAHLLQEEIERITKLRDETDKKDTENYKKLVGVWIAQLKKIQNTINLMQPCSIPQQLKKNPPEPLKGMLRQRYHDKINALIDQAIAQATAKIEAIKKGANENSLALLFTPELINEIERKIEQKIDELNLLKIEFCQNKGITGLLKKCFRCLRSDTFIDDLPPEKLHHHDLAVRKLCGDGLNELLLLYPFAKIEDAEKKCNEELTRCKAKIITLKQKGQYFRAYQLEKQHNSAVQQIEAKKGTVGSSKAMSTCANDLKDLAKAIKTLITTIEKDLDQKPFAQLTSILAVTDTTSLKDEAVALIRDALIDEIRAIFAKNQAKFNLEGTLQTINDEFGLPIDPILEALQKYKNIEDRFLTPIPDKGCTPWILRGMIGCGFGYTQYSYRDLSAEQLLKHKPHEEAAKLMANPPLIISQALSLCGKYNTYKVAMDQVEQMRALLIKNNQFFHLYEFNKKVQDITRPLDQSTILTKKKDSATLEAELKTCNEELSKLLKQTRHHQSNDVQATRFEMVNEPSPEQTLLCQEIRNDLIKKVSQAKDKIAICKSNLEHQREQFNTPSEWEVIIMQKLDDCSAAMEKLSQEHRINKVDSRGNISLIEINPLENEGLETLRTHSREMANKAREIDEIKRTYSLENLEKHAKSYNNVVEQANVHIQELKNRDQLHRVPQWEDSLNQAKEVIAKACEDYSNNLSTASNADKATTAQGQLFAFSRLLEQSSSKLLKELKKSTSTPDAPFRERLAGISKNSPDYQKIRLQCIDSMRKKLELARDWLARPEDMILKITAILSERGLPPAQDWIDELTRQIAGMKAQMEDYLINFEHKGIKYRVENLDGDALMAYETIINDIYTIPPQTSRETVLPQFLKNFENTTSIRLFLQSLNEYSELCSSLENHVVMTPQNDTLLKTHHSIIYMILENLITIKDVRFTRDSIESSILILKSALFASAVPTEYDSDVWSLLAELEKIEDSDRRELVEKILNGYTTKVVLETLPNSRYSWTTGTAPPVPGLLELIRELKTRLPEPIRPLALDRGLPAPPVPPRDERKNDDDDDGYIDIIPLACNEVKRQQIEALEAKVRRCPGKKDITVAELLGYLSEYLTLARELELDT